MDPHDSYINEWSEEIHQDCVNVGWWDDPDRCIYTCIQLVSTEIAEATEGARKDLMDDHLDTFKMEEVELADAVIRLLDLGGKLGLEYHCTTAEHNSWCNAWNPVGMQHLGINKKILEFAEMYMLKDVYPEQDIGHELLALTYSDTIKSILQVARNRGYDFYEAFELKIDYNRSRQDHKRENRAKPGGKAF